MLSSNYDGRRDDGRFRRNIKMDNVSAHTACTRPRVLRPMDNRKNDDLAPVLMHLVDYDVWIFDEFACSLDQSGPTHMRKLVGFENVDEVANAGHDSRRRQLTQVDKLGDEPDLAELEVIACVLYMNLTE